MTSTDVTRPAASVLPGGVYPIRTVAEITGVNAVTLRAWERRYGLVKPSRTESGHRVYSAEHVETIRQILTLLEQGMSIGQVSGVLTVRQERQTASEAGGPWATYRARMMERVCDFDEVGLDQVYNDAVSVYPVDMVSARLIVPMLKALGARWLDGTGTVAEEHFFSTFLRNKLGARLHHRSRRAGGPRLVLACLPKEQHEIGLLLFALSALDHSFRLVLLGADVPMEDIPGVCERTGCAAVVLAGSAEPVNYSLADSLVGILDRVDVPVFVGGRVSLVNREVIENAGAHVLGEDVGAALRRMTLEFGLGQSAE